MDHDETLAATIREVARRHPDVASPASLARFVLDRIPVGQERRLLAALLPQYVGEVVRRAESVPTADLDPDSAWHALLRDRVPTEDGYRFLADCSAADIEAGAVRRRSMATNLARRAEVYESIASSMAEAEAPAVADLEPLTALARITGREDPLRALGALEATEIVGRIVGSDSTARLVALGYARRNLPDAVWQATEDDEARDKLHTALQRLTAQYGTTPPGEGTRRRAELDAIVAARDEVRAAGGRLRGRVREVADRLSQMNSDAVAQLLVQDREALEAAVMAEARHDVAPQVGEALRTPAVLPHALAACRTIVANLNTAVARARDEGRQPDTRVTRDRQRVSTLLSTLQRRHDEHRRATGAAHERTPMSQWSPWEQAVLREHRAEVLAERDRLLEQYPALSRADQMPRDGVVAWALQRGHLDPPSTAVAELLALNDADFREQVAADVSGTCHDTRLRDAAALERWRTAMVELKDMTNERIAESGGDQQTRRNRVRFVIGVDARLTEQRGLLLQVKDSIHARLEEQERASGTRALLDEMYDEAARTIIRRVRGQE